MQIKIKAIYVFVPTCFFCSVPLTTATSKYIVGQKFVYTHKSRSKDHGLSAAEAAGEFFHQVKLSVLTLTSSPFTAVLPQ